MELKNDPNAEYFSKEDFTRKVRKEEIRSRLEYRVYMGAGALGSLFPPDPVAWYEKRTLDTGELYLWWKEVLGPHFIEKPPPGYEHLEPPKPAVAEPVFRKTPQREQPPVPKVEALPPPKPEPKREQKQPQPRRVRQEKKREPPIEFAKPEPVDPYPQRTGPAPKKPEPKTKDRAIISGINYDWNDD